MDDPSESISNPLYIEFPSIYLIVAADLLTLGCTLLYFREDLEGLLGHVVRKQPEVNESVVESRIPLKTPYHYVLTVFAALHDIFEG